MLKPINGFSMIEMAVVLSVSAMIMGGGLAAAKPIIKKVEKQNTERQMEKINDRLASYVHKNNRLPCPADPAATSQFGAERASCTGADVVGVVPFRALGLKENEVRDSWGNFITYHVSPAFAINAADVPDNDHNQVHEFCRSEDWITDPFNPEGPPTPDAMPYWALNSNFSNINEKKTELTSPDGNVSLTLDNNLAYQQYRDSVGVVTDGSGYGGYRGIRPGEDPIINFDHPAESFTIKLTELEEEVGTNLTFQFWGSPDGGPDDYVEVSVDLTQEWVDEHVQPDEDGSQHKGWTHFVFNPDTLEGHSSYKAPFEVPGVDKIYKVRILTFDGPGEKMSYDIFSLPEVKYADISQDGLNPVNVNPAKARFCCPMSHDMAYGPGTDLQIVDASGDRIVLGDRSVVNYDDKDIKVSGSVESDIFVPAFALISHGRNAHGAYQANASGNRINISATVGDGFGVSEASNSDGDRTYVYQMPDSSRDTTYYDDIVMWRTQDQIYGEFGSLSCQTP